MKVSLRCILVVTLLVAHTPLLANETSCEFAETVTPDYAGKLYLNQYGVHYFYPPQPYAGAAPQLCTAYQNDWDAHARAGGAYYQNTNWVWNGHYDEPAGYASDSSVPDYPGYEPKTNYVRALSAYGTYWEWTSSYTCTNPAGCGGCTRYNGETYTASYLQACTTC